MKPKKAGGESKKTEKKKQEKVIEDKTFGLKNKNKSKTVQKFIKGVATQVKLGNQSATKLVEDEHAERKRKKKEEEEAALMASLFKSVETVKKAAEDEEDDDRPQICAYFKQGLCQKGKKCKYSHDLGGHDTKNEEVDLYTEQRYQLFGTGQKEEEETVENWDARKLEEVVKQKEQKYKSKNNTTSIVCKFFLDAVEKSKYGWKWVCPNGMDCIYRHCLPPGFVFKKKGMDLGGDIEIEILEEKLEEERAKLTGTGTPVTLERFLAWKEARKKKKEDEIEEKRKAEEKKSGGKHHALTGRALFKFDPTLFVDDDEAAGETEYEIREENNEEEEEEEEKKNYENSDDEGENHEQSAQDYDFNEGEETKQEGTDNQGDKQADAENEKEAVAVEGEKKKKKKKKKKAPAEVDLKVNEELFKEMEDLEF